MGTFRDEAQEAERISKALKVAVEVLGSSVAAHDWLDSQIPVLGGARPIELVVASEEGLLQVLTILGRLDHGVYS